MLAFLLTDQLGIFNLAKNGFVMLTINSPIFTSFRNLPDPRRQSANLKHNLHEMVALTLCAVICNANTWVDVELFAKKRIGWLKRFLILENGIPSHDTLGRVFAALDTHAFAACIADWIEQLNLELKGKGVHIDGKVARHSFDTASNQTGLHLVSAWCNELSVCLGQVSTDEKSNEITAVPMLLDLLEIQGAVVTFGEDASRIRKGEGQEVFGVFRRVALSILRKDTSLPKTSLRAKRFIASLDTNALEAIISSN